MVDQPSYEHPMRGEAKREHPHDTDESVNALTTATPHKRKRDPSDHDGSARRGGPGNNTRRPSFKRMSPTNNVPLANHDATGNGNDISDPSGVSFLSAHNTSTAGEDEMHNSSNTSLDFSALSQQHAGEQVGHQNGGHDISNAPSTAAAALAGIHPIYPTMTVPQPTGLSFESAGSGGDGERNLDFDGSQNQHGDPTYGLGALREGQQDVRDSSSGGGQKPAVGSEEWHKLIERLMYTNGGAVERRRRETINEGINELAKIVPGCEKNKGSILQRAVHFITQLKENEAQNIEKWTLEKLLTEQAIAELSTSVEKLKKECERAWRDSEMWKKTCQNAGLAPSEDHASHINGNGDS
ncbi:MAG: basic helix-loop-helix protein [Candelina submexicana]|nr:MAG: basic helix-loop-helix protein [Candelina submexicana]